MPSRTRLRQSASSGGSFLAVLDDGSTVTDNPEYIQGADYCEDVVGEGLDNMLTIVHDWYERPQFTYKRPDGKRICENYVPAYFRFPYRNYASVNFTGDYGRPTDYQLAVMALDRTNPSRAYVDLGVTIGEMTELPFLLFKAGLRLLKGQMPLKSFSKLYSRIRRKHFNDPDGLFEDLVDDAATGHIFTEFGIKPLVSDFTKLLDFQKKVDNRVKLLHKLKAKPMLRKVNLWSNSASYTWNYGFTANSSPTYCFINYNWVRDSCTWKTWGYVRWTPSPPLLTASDEAIQQMARKAVLGATIDLATAWELMPWSWLFDWFANVGTYLSAHRNLVPVTPSTPVICETKHVEGTMVNTSNSLDAPPGFHTVTLHSVRKTRRSVSAALPSASLPLITGGQAGILKSLIVLRRSRTI